VLEFRVEVTPPCQRATIIVIFASQSYGGCCRTIHPTATVRYGTDTLKPYLAMSWDYVTSLKPKPTKKPKNNNKKKKKE
jgi:hypothetical protein